MFIRIHYQRLSSLIHFNTTTLNIQNDIKATLAYYDLFYYPLTQFEIFQFLHCKYEYSEFTAELESMVNHQQVFRTEDFYSLNNDPALCIRRKKGNQMARKMMITADKKAEFLFKFPYVRGVGISGSLSKNYADEFSDIDFFIITKANRLWVARTFLHLFKKFTFISGQQHFFCMNYFISEKDLTIEEKNIYTATELVTLIPLKGSKTFHEFNGKNQWVKEFLPNHSMKISYIRESGAGMLKRGLEFLFDNIAGSALDRILMKITKSRWDKKTRERKLNSRGIIMGMKVSRNYAKPHPGNFQEKLVAKYEEKIVEIMQVSKPAMSE